MWFTKHNPRQQNITVFWDKFDLQIYKLDY